MWLRRTWALTDMRALILIAKATMAPCIYKGVSGVRGGGGDEQLAGRVLRWACARNDVIPNTFCA